MAGKLSEVEGRCKALDETLQEKTIALKSSNKSAGDDAQGEVRAFKEKVTLQSHAVGPTM